MTRNDAIRALSSLPDSTLIRLVELSDKIITPDEYQLSAVTYEQIVDRVLNVIAPAKFPEWTDKTEADFGVFLTEVFALISENRFWYINGFGNEGFVTKASVFSSLYAHALSRGYQPRLRTCAVVRQDIIFAPSLTATKIAKGDLVFTGDDGVEWSNIKELYVPQGVTNVLVNVECGRGNYRKLSEPFNGRHTRVNTDNLVPSLTEVKVGGEDWYKVETFASSASTSKHFMVIPEVRSTIIVKFGRNGYGARPSVDTSVEVTYFEGGGLEGNSIMPNALTTVVRNNSNRVIVSTYNSAPLSLGVEQEGLADVMGVEELRQNILRHVRTQGRIVNKDDAVNVLISRGYFKANAWFFANQLYFSVIEKDTLTLVPQATLDIVSEELKEIAVGGYIIGGVVLRYVPWRVNGNVVCEAQYSNTEITIAVRKAIRDFFSPQGSYSKIGWQLSSADLVAYLLQAVPGVKVFTITNWNNLPSPSTLLTLGYNEALQFYADSVLASVMSITTTGGRP
jgi:hypothetical protein